MNMKFIYLFLILTLPQFNSTDCKIERGESSIYKKRFKNPYVTRIRKDQVPNGEMVVEFGYGFGDDMKVSYRDSIVFSDSVQLADRPRKGFMINIEKKTSSKIYFHMLNSNICCEVDIKMKYRKYRMLYVTRFKNVWYFTFSNYIFAP